MCLKFLLSRSASNQLTTDCLLQGETPSDEVDPEEQACKDAYDDLVVPKFCVFSSSSPIRTRVVPHLEGMSDDCLLAEFAPGGWLVLA